MSGCDLVALSIWHRAMSNFPYNIRNYQSTDFNKYVLLYAGAEKLEPSGRCVSPQFVAEQLERSNYSPEQDLFIVETDEDIVGYMNITPELTIGRVVLDCWVHPEHRRRGLATKLLGYATNRARELGAKIAHVNMAEDNVVAGRALSRLGFSLVRRFLELRLDIADVGGLDIDPAATGCLYLQLGEEDKLTQLQNRAFSGTWGFNPNTVEEIAFRTSLSTCSLDDIMLFYEGDKAIGYCWIGISCEEGIPSVRKGQILMLGVDPHYRGKGIGKKLVLAGLARLKSKGLQVAELTVDSENKTACALYQAIGFEVKANTFWYEKVIS
ncbi:MAG TPA: GNAT family N-acetyltransferase [Dehalococcoidia bacterium]|nr:GNAT family N-acetyltransferase [Dehalococcoidia bacterium]